ncbi:hypothetical protein CJ030_MR4G020653 [Morella rubra]|uniref:Uncharacterized protein n=1 Tax=Morella rubra TaxID=262757 RepID=A0A6A1VVG7_9ROSI|nr:hypothetical protein CJ030_MR4G020653 [Morella rubra]
MKNKALMHRLIAGIPHDIHNNSSLQKEISLLNMNKRKSRLNIQHNRHPRRNVELLHSSYPYRAWGLSP